MKALKDCKWYIRVHHFAEAGYSYSWEAYVREGKFENLLTNSAFFKTRKGCENNFIRLAKINGITNYEFT